MDDAVLVNEWTWKTPAMRDMALAVCRLALARGAVGEFSALDLPTHGADQHGGSGIAGSVFRQLKAAGIIARVGVDVDGTWYPRNVVNANGNPVGVYRLRSAALATALIERHAPGSVPTLKQLVLL
jgi:hypothetical protein